MTRRTILRLIPALPGGLMFGSTGPSTALYRADCQVSFLGVPVFSRANVGSAHIEVKETPGSVALTFQAGSLPERARGLNRLGFIQEFVTQKDGGLHSAYFGFITSSPEKNLEQAKAALEPTGEGAVAYMAVEGSATAARSHYDLYQLELPSAWNYSRCTEVVGKVREFLAKKTLKPARSEASAEVLSPRTFLFAVREAMRSSDTIIRSAFLYNGKSYRLQVEKTKDKKQGGAMRLNGNVQNAKTGEKTPFRLWFHEGSDLPTRFEYRPRGYLNLTFERISA
jgi:hypothetical protein